MKFVVVALTLVAVVNADQTFYNFLTTWGLIPSPVGNAYVAQPRTETDAINEGFVKISGCEDDSEFKGNRYAPGEGEWEFFVVYDVNGFIAGMHSVVPIRDDITFNEQYYKFSTSGYYRMDTINGQDAYLTTAYFIEPSKICTTGRTQEEFDLQGTLGDGLFLLKNDELIVTPLTEDAAIEDPIWFKHFCFVGMGNHFFNIDPSIPADDATGCDIALPLQLIYHNNVLNGFVWQHVAPIPGDRWEEPNSFAVGAIVDNPPTCLLDQVDNPGQRTMHVYIREWDPVTINCIF